MNAELQPQPRRRPAGTPPPLPPAEPPPLRPEMFETHEGSFEVREQETEHLTISSASVSKAEIKPAEYTGKKNEDAFAVFRDTEEAMVNDGMGGTLAGEVASRMVRDSWQNTVRMEKVELARTPQPERDTLWEHIMTEAQPLILPAFIEGDAEYKPARERAVREAREKFAKMKNPPDAVKLEAMARFQALKELSRMILRAAEENPKELNGMATTSSGVKVMDVDSETWGVFWTVGDSQALIEAPGGTALEQAVPSDGGLELAMQLGAISREQAADFTNPTTRELRFSKLNQALGQKTEVMPHITVRKLHSGQRIRLASDGLTDSFLDEDPTQTVLDRSEGATLTRGTRRAVEGAIDGFRTEKGKAGADDITVVDIEVKPLVPDRVINAEVDWALWVADALREAGVSGVEEDRIIRELSEGVIRSNIVKQALSEISLIEHDRTVSGDEARSIIQRYLAERIETLRSPDLDVGDMAAE